MIGVDTIIEPYHPCTMDSFHHIWGGKHKINGFGPIGLSIRGVNAMKSTDNIAQPGFGNKEGKLLFI
eukprot:5123696-Ditylum_brightwellii.AAC.1